MRAFIGGLGAGVALGILFAPRSGVETRSKLKSKADEINDLARSQFDRAKSVTSEVGERVTGFRDQASEMINDTDGSATQSESSGAEVGPLALLNSGSREDLIKVRGIGEATADRIIAGRPFTFAREVVDNGIMPETTFYELSKAA